jgi:hypothetical protein
LRDEREERDAESVPQKAREDAAHGFSTNFFIARPEAAG